MTGTNEQLEFAENYFAKLIAFRNSLDMSKLLEVANLIIRTSRDGGRVYIAGNGGSCSLAEHFVTDLGVGSLGSGRPVQAISLTSNNSVVTATANDYNYSEIFSRQLKLYARADDVLIVISSSGNSSNLVACTQTARKIGLASVGILGFDGGLLAQEVDFCIHVETPQGEYGPVEDIHSSICHILALLVRHS
jgi:D-sedoheptulose 7-phosphate isomerase